MLFREMSHTLATAGLIATTASLIASRPAQAEICLWDVICIRESVIQPSSTSQPEPNRQPTEKNRPIEVNRSRTSTRRRASEYIRSMRFTLPANQTWFDTGIDLEPSEVLAIEVTGHWSNGGDDPQRITASGFDDFYHPNAIDSSSPFASLIGSLGNGDIFMVGSSRSRTIRDHGKLFLSMNDVPGTFRDNTGTLTVDVLVTRDF